MHDLMAAVLDPATDVIWGAAGEVITVEGARDLAPTTDEGWVLVRNAAAVVAESGNLLMLPGRERNSEDWREYSQALTRLGVLTMAAADAKDDAAIFDLGGQLYNVCVACHQSYAPDA
jgi:mono/diheme cytochrome c family protein